MAEIEKGKLKLYALTATNISKRSEMEIKKCTDFDTCSAAKDPLSFSGYYSDASACSNGDLSVDADVAMQAYHTMKQLPCEPANKYRISMEDKIKVIQ